MKKALKHTREIKNIGNTKIFSSDFKGIQDVDLIEEIKKVLDFQVDDESISISKAITKKSEQ